MIILKRCEISNSKAVFTLGPYRGFGPHSVWFGIFGVKCEQQSPLGKQTVPPKEELNVNKFLDSVLLHIGNVRHKVT